MLIDKAQLAIYSEVEKLLSTPPELLPNVHIIGGGGVGMSALGMMLLQSGYRVTASDQTGSAYLEKLASMGAVTWIGSSPERIPVDSVIFRSSAVPENDPEALHSEVVSRGKMGALARHYLLKFITSKYFTIAIAGAHGKTTTSSWTGYMLEQAGLDPSVITGGTVKQWNSNVRTGQGFFQNRPLLVIEADESDGSFLWIQSDIAVINNVELDHVDRYSSEQDLEQLYRHFAMNCVENKGSLVFSPQALDFARKYFPSFSIHQIEIKGSSIHLGDDHSNSTVRSGLPGYHNLVNAVSVIQIGNLLNLNIEQIRPGIEQFQGVGRRMEVLGELVNSQGARISVMDDYAHHPTEVDAVLSALTEQNKNMKIFWEPHRYSRFIHFGNEFMDVFKKHSLLASVYLLPVYDAGGESALANDTGFKKSWESWQENTEQPGSLNANNLNQDTLILFLGAGNSSRLAREFLHNLMHSISDK